MIWVPLLNAQSFKILMPPAVYSTSLGCSFEGVSKVVCNHVVMVNSEHQAVTFVEMICFFGLSLDNQDTLLILFIINFYCVCD